MIINDNDNKNGLLTTFPLQHGSTSATCIKKENNYNNYDNIVGNLSSYVEVTEFYFCGFII